MTAATLYDAAFVDRSLFWYSGTQGWVLGESSVLGGVNINMVRSFFGKLFSSDAGVLRGQGCFSSAVCL